MRSETGKPLCAYWAAGSSTSLKVSLPKRLSAACITKSGLRPGCDKGVLFMIAGVNRVPEVESRLSGWGSWTPLSNPSARSRQLLAAGIALDEPRRGGITARTEAVRELDAVAPTPPRPGPARQPRRGGGDHEQA